MGAVAALVLALLVASGPDASTAAGASSQPGSAQTGCANQSSASFPRAYSDARNRVVGPLALVGGAAHTDAATARRFGGQKYPLLVKAGHTVIVSVDPSARSRASLGYATDAQDDGHHTVTFMSCSARAARSTAGGPVTFWSGFVMVSEPLCVPLDVYVDGARRPRRVRLAIGRSCTQPPPLRGCADHVEDGRGPADPAGRPTDVVVGPLRFAGLRRIAGRRELALIRSGRRYGVKSGVSLPAGVRATLTIGRSARSWVRLTYAPRVPGASPLETAAIRFQACASDHPAFSYDGPVGPISGFSGGFVLGHGGCVPLEVRVAGRPVARARIPFGTGRRCG